MGAPLGSRAIAPYCQRIGAASDSVPLSRLWRPVAQLQPLVHELPERLHVPAGGERHVHEIQRDHALVEPAVKLVVAVLVLPRRERAAAAHDREAVALLELLHLLFGDVVRHQPLGRARGRELRQVVERRAGAHVVLLEHVDELRERRRDPHASFFTPS